MARTLFRPITRPVCRPTKHSQSTGGHEKAGSSRCRSAAEVCRRLPCRKAHRRTRGRRGLADPSAIFRWCRRLRPASAGPRRRRGRRSLQLRQCHRVRPARPALWRRGRHRTRYFAQSCTSNYPVSSLAAIGLRGQAPVRRCPAQDRRPAPYYASTRTQTCVSGVEIRSFGIECSPTRAVLCLSCGDNGIDGFSIPPNVRHFSGYAGNLYFRGVEGPDFASLERLCGFSASVRQTRKSVHKIAFRSSTSSRPMWKRSAGPASPHVRRRAIASADRRG